MQESVHHSEIQGTQTEEGSLKNLILSIRDWVGYFWSKWYVIAIFGILGALAGLGYAFSKKPVYTATTSFVLETGGKGNSLGAYAGIASAFGIDLGGAGGGLFEGENILELYKSRNMISRALLSEEVFNGKRQLLIDRYIDLNQIRKGWDKNPVLKNIQFAQDNRYPDATAQLLHDSIMTGIVSDIRENLNVSKKDKKLNIIYVTVNSPDELFAKAFNKKLVENVNQFYLDTKTKRSLENVAILQTKVDSVRGILSGSISRAAVVVDATPNQNPTRMAQRVVPVQNARVSAEVNQQVLGTLLQNLELSKISLQKETPLIQIVDDPVLPLEKKGFGKLKGLVLGGVIGVLIIMVFLVSGKVIKEAVKE
ncbi:MAG: Wzz/FepE/Etk N-terminal domain-containing protein [Niabella sp.]